MESLSEGRYALIRSPPQTSSHRSASTTGGDEIHPCTSAPGGRDACANSQLALPAHQQTTCSCFTASLPYRCQSRKSRARRKNAVRDEFFLYCLIARYYLSVTVPKQTKHKLSLSMQCELATVVTSIISTTSKSCEQSTEKCGSN